MSEYQLIGYHDLTELITEVYDAAQTAPIGADPFSVDNIRALLDERTRIALGTAPVKAAAFHIQYPWMDVAATPESNTCAFADEMGYPKTPLYRGDEIMAAMTDSISRDELPSDYRKGYDAALTALAHVLSGG